MVYVPHLDYDLQRFGPSGPQASAAAAELDACLAPLLDDALNSGVAIVVVSEYGITDARRAIDVNRALQADRLLEVHTQKGMEYLDPWTSRAFAVADHQIAHIYIRDSSDVPGVRSLVAGLPGVDEVLDRDAQACQGLDHPRAGELVAVAEPDAWFTYYWLNDARAPDFAHGVEIHRKPGYDPAELFFDPRDPARQGTCRAQLHPQEGRTALCHANRATGPELRTRHPRQASRHPGCRTRAAVQATTCPESSSGSQRLTSALSYSPSRASRRRPAEV
jgi:predicted AlkP superfamily pyrophosphatase or phosphodiesterase